MQSMLARRHNEHGRYESHLKKCVSALFRLHTDKVRRYLLSTCSAGNDRKLCLHVSGEVFGWSY
jgi:hypothetical protein